MTYSEKEHLRRLMTEAITLLCGTSLQYEHDISIEGLVGVTLDKTRVVLVSLNETVDKLTLQARSQMPFSEQPSPMNARKRRSSRDCGPTSPSQPKYSQEQVVNSENAASGTTNLNEICAGIDGESVALMGGNDIPNKYYMENESLEEAMPIVIHPREMLNSATTLDESIPQMNNSLIEVSEDEEMYGEESEYADDSSQSTEFPNLQLRMDFSSRLSDQDMLLQAQAPSKRQCPICGVIVVHLSNHMNYMHFLSSGEPILSGEEPAFRGHVVQVTPPDTRPGAKHKRRPMRTVELGNSMDCMRVVLLEEGSFLLRKGLMRRKRLAAIDADTVFYWMSREPGHPEYVGQFVSGLEFAQTRKTSVFYKCPPDLISDAALSKYGVNRTMYTWKYMQQPRLIIGNIPMVSGDWTTFCGEVLDHEPSHMPDIKPNLAELTAGPSIMLEEMSPLDDADIPMIIDVQGSDRNENRKKLPKKNSSMASTAVISVPISNDLMLVGNEETLISPNSHTHSDTILNENTVESEENQLLSVHGTHFPASVKLIAKPPPKGNSSLILPTYMATMEKTGKTMMEKLVPKNLSLDSAAAQECDENILPSTKQLPPNVQNQFGLKHTLLAGLLSEPDQFPVETASNVAYNACSPKRTRKDINFTPPSTSKGSNIGEKTAVTHTSLLPASLAKSASPRHRTRRHSLLKPTLTERLWKKLGSE